MLQTVLGAKESDYHVDCGYGVIGSLSCPAHLFSPNVWREEPNRLEICKSIIQTDVAATCCVLHKGVVVSPWNNRLYDKLLQTARDHAWVGAHTCNAMKAMRCDLQQIVATGHHTLQQLFYNPRYLDDELAIAVNAVWNVSTRLPFWRYLINIIHRAQIAYVFTSLDKAPVVIDGCIGLSLLLRDKTLIIYLILFADTEGNIWQNPTIGTPQPILQLVDTAKAHLHGSSPQP